MVNKLVNQRNLISHPRARNNNYNEKAFEITRPDINRKPYSSGTLPFDEYPKLNPYNDDTRQILTYTYKGKNVKIIVDPVAGGFRFNARVGRIKTASRWAPVRTQAYIKYYDLIDHTNDWIDKEYV